MMSKYRMNIKFREEDLEVIAKAHQKVELVKHSVDDNGALSKEFPTDYNDEKNIEE
ncbi:MAG: hypothetical protein LUH21_04305 [Clostridiales bacterium]|nr:hypothetical protein [Clostridiales bacterium]